MSNAKLQQGSVLTKEDAFELGLINSADCNNRAIVISHDCDLANNVEYVEFIIGTLISTPDPLRQHAHHPRQLHLTFDLNEPFHIELDYYSKKIIEKNKVISKVTKIHVISEHGKQILKQWLAAGYGRPAFPNEFEEIALEKCIAVADTHISLADIRKIDQWRLEYMSLKNNPPSSFLLAGNK